MKKLLLICAAMMALSMSHAKIYKMTGHQVVNPQDDVGDGVGFLTDKGDLWFYVESPAVHKLMNAKAGECYDIVYGKDYSQDKAKKVKCPNGKKK